MIAQPTLDARRAEAGREVRRLAGKLVLLGEAYARRNRLRPRVGRAISVAATATAGACMRLAARILGAPLASHPHVEAQLVSVYGPGDADIPLLAREMADDVAREARGR